VAASSISVVIPVFNGEGFLGEAIESVLAQRYVPLELIVVDDGSTDGSAAVAEQFGEVKLIRTENRGPAAARNTGVARSTGELIAFLDADNLMKPDRLVRQVAALEDDPSAAFALSRGEVITEPGIELPALRRAQARDLQKGYVPMSLLTARATFELVGPFDETLRMGEDTDWLFRAFEAGLRPALIPEQLIVRRFHGRNLSYDAGAVRAARFMVLKRRAARRRAAGPGKPPASPVPETVLLGLPNLNLPADGREKP
jgi:glycosyltransferase involved in cell wall biosynthesis